MRLICALGLMAFSAAVPVAHGQTVKSVKAGKAGYTCESLCAELFASIRADPEKMVMRLEEALVISESCAGEIVTVAIDAVNADPAQVDKIVRTALDMAPRRSAIITTAVRNYSPTEVAAAIPAARDGPPAGPEIQVEVRRAEIPGPPVVLPPRPLAGEEVRRAELPLENRSLPIVEVRRAEPPAAAILMQEPQVMQPPPPNLELMNVPKAKPLKTKRR